MIIKLRNHETKSEIDTKSVDTFNNINNIENNKNNININNQTLTTGPCFS